MKRYLAIAAILVQFAVGEDISVVVPAGARSNSITLDQGDTAELVFADPGTGAGAYPVAFRMECTTAGKTAFISCWKRQYSDSGYNSTITNPVTIAGPATIVFAVTDSGGYPNSLATLRITRAGTASPPAAIPQEAGSKFDVILESSSDLINWTPTNPGEYSGTEPKRFFRTRIVKKP